MAFVVTAVATAIELGTAAAIATAVTEVGISLTVVGAVTGNRDLMKIGAVLGLAGGVGGLVAGMAESAGTTALSTSMSDAASVGAANAGTEAADLAGVMGGASGEAASGLVNSAIDGGGASAIENAGIDAAGNALGDAPVADALQAAPATPAAPDVSGAPDTSGLQGAPGTATPLNTELSAGAKAPYTPWEADFPGSTAASQGGGNSVWESFKDFVNKNPTLAKGGLQVIGGALSGIQGQSQFEQKLALQQRELDLKSYGSQVGQWQPQTVNPMPGVSGGIINGVRR